MEKRCCHFCQSYGAKCRCSQCKQVYFCNRMCQMKAWIEHRSECILIFQLRKQQLDDELSNEQPLSIQQPFSNEQPLSMMNTKNCIQLQDDNDDVDDNVDDLKNIKEILKVKMNKNEQLSSSNCSSQSSSSCSSNENNTHCDDSHPHQDESFVINTKNKKSNSKKKRRKRGSHSNTRISVEKKKLSWGSVKVKEFSRFPGGGSAIPSDGTWALGLGEPLQEYDLGSVDQFEDRRLVELDKRTQALSKKKQKDACHETRQYVFRKGAKNPLFGRIDEKARKELFFQTCRTSSFEMATLSTLSKSKSKSKSNSNLNLNSTLSNSTLSDQELVNIANKQLSEFEEIRLSRKEAGCQCGKQINVAKMSTKSLRKYLKSHGVHQDVARDELILLVRQVIKESKYCAAEYCSCKANGIECHRDVCKCHDCSNPMDSYTYKPVEVAEYRKKCLEYKNVPFINGPPAITA